MGIKLQTILCLCWESDFGQFCVPDENQPPDNSVPPGSHTAVRPSCKLSYAELEMYFDIEMKLVCGMKEYMED
jgi:hypothetical protein